MPLRDKGICAVLLDAAGEGAPFPLDDLIRKPRNAFDRENGAVHFTALAWKSAEY